MAQECQHIEDIDFQGVLSNVSALFGAEGSHKLLYTSNEIQEARENWVCIDVDNDQQDELCKESRHDH
jgi:hypothetical protein